MRLRVGWLVGWSVGFSVTVYRLGARDGGWWKRRSWAFSLIFFLFFLFVLVFWMGDHRAERRMNDTELGSLFCFFGGIDWVFHLSLLLCCRFDIWILNVFFSSLDVGVCYVDVWLRGCCVLSGWCSVRRREDGLSPEMSCQFFVCVVIVIFGEACLSRI